MPTPLPGVDFSEIPVKCPAPAGPTSTFVLASTDAACPTYLISAGF